MRIVIDTNIFISHLLLPDSKPAEAVRKAFRSHTLLMSEIMLLELDMALARRKFDRYISGDERRLFLHKLHKNCEMVAIIQRVHASRDESDDRVLELAVNGVANCVISGDKDLLSLHPFRHIPIVNAAGFLAMAGV